MNHQAEVEQAAIGAQVHGFDVCAYGAKG
ncbi:MAG: hypothetical protein K0Q59_1254, partial [Paenibacillus sp.]|nr:hypothetical protein [Paenibacillus sp.]